jgi:hypothetical protein
MNTADLPKPPVKRRRIRKPPVIIHAKHHPDDGKKIVLLTEVDEYVMVQRPERMPYVMLKKDWHALAGYQPPPPKKRKKAQNGS